MCTICYVSQTCLTKYAWVWSACAIPLKLYAQVCTVYYVCQAFSSQVCICVVCMCATHVVHTTMCMTLYVVCATCHVCQAFLPRYAMHTMFTISQAFEPKYACVWLCVCTTPVSFHAQICTTQYFMQYFMPEYAMHTMF